MARQQTLKQAFAAVGRKTVPPTRSMRQSTLNFDGCAPALRDDSDADSDCLVGIDCGCGCETEAEHIALMNEDYDCICAREKCDYEDDPESCICNACWDQRLQKDPLLFLVRPGYFHHHHEEDMFMNNSLDKTSCDLNNLQFYEEICKLRDLKEIVQQRGLRDPFPAGLTLKYFYFKVLLPADTNRVFRFMDLPAEMRNEVYEYLLVKEPYYPCYPEILRASRIIHEEAKEILYADNVIDFHVSSTPSSKWVRLRNKLLPGDASVAQLPSAMDMYPGFLARIRKLEISICVHFQPMASAVTRNSTADYVRSSLLTLASVVMDGCRLRTLRLSVNGSGVDEEALASMLYPLRRLRNVDVQFITKEYNAVTVPDFLQDDMITEMRLQDPVFNTLKHCRLVLSEAKAYLTLIDTLDPMEDGRIMRPSNSHSAIIARQVGDLKMKMVDRRSLFADWLGEVKVQTRLAKLQDLLRQVFPEQIKTLTDNFAKATGERTTYQTTEHQRWSIRDLARAKSPSPDPAPL